MKKKEIEKALVSASLTAAMLPHSCFDCPVRKTCTFRGEIPAHTVMDCADHLFDRIEAHAKEGDL